MRPVHLLVSAVLAVPAALGAAAPASAAVTVPTAPRSVTATPGNGYADISWTAPLRNGGAPITGYRATALPGGRSCTPAPPGRSCRITGLVNGRSYTVTVTARNRAGVSRASAAATVRPRTVAGAPRAVHVRPASEAAIVSWTPPLADGGATITRYDAVASPGGQSCSAVPPSGTCTIAGLTDGTRYLVRVAAVNPAGNGATSAAVAVQPVSPGRLAAVGDSYYGQGGTGISGQLPGAVANAGADWAGVSVAGVSACATRVDGTLWCWGVNTSGQLGLGDTTDRSAPAQVGSGTDWAQVAAGPEHTCAVKTDHTLWCWGQDGFGQLGRLNGGGSDQTTPVQVGSDTDWSRATSGHQYSCALKQTGSLWCWGRNDVGQLGLGHTTVPIDTPTQVGTDTDWAEVSLGTAHSCARRASNTLWCWGDNAGGQLGHSDTTERHSPVQVGAAADWAAVGLGQLHTCGVRQSGTLWCWGSNGNAQLGLNDRTQRSTPTQVGAATDWTAVSGGSDGSCGLRSNGTLWCWGDPFAWGSLGTASAFPETPSQVGTSTSWSQVVTGNEVQCGLDGTALRCWGANGMPQAIGRPITLPDVTDTTTGTAWTRVAAADASACGVRSSGTLWCWGYNLDGELGLGDGIQRTVPTRVGSSAAWTDVSLGGPRTCGLQHDGSLWCWGDNDDGNVGDGTTVDRTTPVRVGAATGWAQVSVGDGHSCAVRTDGSLWCWGDNVAGQLGIPGWAWELVPARVGNGTSWARVAAGAQHTCATKVDGTLWCWGRWNDGRLGLGGAAVADVETPTQVGVDSDWTQASAGSDHTCAVKTGGTLWCWGGNDDDHLGTGGGSVDVPTQVGAATDWASVDLEGPSSCGSRSTGAIWCWGDNSQGQLGTGDTTDRATPALVAGAGSQVTVGWTSSYLWG